MRRLVTPRAGSKIAVPAVRTRPMMLVSARSPAARAWIASAAMCDATFAERWFHWFFFGQTQKSAEQFINANPDAWYTAAPEHMGQEAMRTTSARSTARARSMP